MEVTWRYVKKSEVCSGEKLERVVMTSKSSKVGKNDQAHNLKILRNQ